MKEKTGLTWSAGISWPLLVSLGFLMLAPALWLVGVLLPCGYGCGNQHGDLWSWGASLLGVWVLCWCPMSYSQSSLFVGMQWTNLHMGHWHCYCLWKSNYLISMASTFQLQASAFPVIHLEPPWPSPGHLGIQGYISSLPTKVLPFANAAPSHPSHVRHGTRYVLGFS